MALFSPSTMIVQEEEIRWALAIKGAALADEELKPLTDFDYTHYALVFQEDVEKALEHIRYMQYFFEEYNIRSNDPEEGTELIRQVCKMHPGFLLSVDWDEMNGHFVAVYDFAKRNPKAVDLPEEWRIHLGGYFYIMQAITCNMQAIREGVVHIGECEGMVLKLDRKNREHHQQSWEHLFTHYPLRHKEISWLRTPLSANLLISFVKPLMNHEMASKFKMGCNFYGYDGRIDVLFKQPTPEIAETNMIYKIHSLLLIRQQNEQSFKLPDIAPDYDSLSEMDEHDSIGRDDIDFVEHQVEDINGDDASRSGGE